MTSPLLFKKDFLTVDDLDFRYWHVPLHSSQYPLFGCSIYKEKSTKYYQWTILFLGLSDAVYISTCLPLPIVKHLRASGWEGIIYIDDLGTLRRSYYECLYWKLFAGDILARAGWIVNESKDQEPA